MTDISVADLVIYPIKGGRGSQVKKVDVTTEGFIGDRVFTVTREGRRVAQKQIPRLKYLQAVWGSNGLVLNYPGERSVFFEPPSRIPVHPLLPLPPTLPPP